jgi:hypothetical protein
VLDTGTSNWIPALDDRAGCHPGGICESAMVQRITGNILRLFGQGPAARHQPSVPNWRQVTASKTMTPNEVGSRLVEGLIDVTNMDVSIIGDTNLRPA